MDRAENYDIIILGAGITGLYLARSLSLKGYAVLVVEARERTGGRIHTLHNVGFSRPVDTGAEFVHGNPPLIESLLREAKVSITKGTAKTHGIERGNPEREQMFPSDLNKVDRYLQNLKTDMPMSEFLAEYFNKPEDAGTREHVTKMVQGFDAADVTRISAFAIRDEWSHETEFPGSRPVGGYSQVTDYLEQAARTQQAKFELSFPVSEIKWTKGKVVLRKSSGKEFNGKKLVITVPVGVLKANSLNFSPALPKHSAELDHLESGGVIKFLAEFHEPIWENHSLGIRTFPGMSFLFSDATVPTWWTQRPSNFPLLTGWLSGPAVKKNLNELEQLGISSLAYIFDTTEIRILQMMRKLLVIDWQHDPFARGAYGYKTVGTDQALDFLCQPVEETLYFAGEGFNQGSEMGTIEAALQSAEAVLQKLDQ
jgi:monoamine oxidase